MTVKRTKIIVCLILMLLVLSACKTKTKIEPNGKETNIGDMVEKKGAIEIEPGKPEPAYTLPDVVPLEPIKPEPTYTLPDVVPLEPIKPEPTYSLPDVVPLEPIKPETTYTLPEVVPLKPITGAPTPSPSPKPTESPKNVDWVLSVDDNAEFVVGDIGYNGNLYVSMNKNGGSNCTGTYTGKILYTCSIKDSEMERIFEEDSELEFLTGYYNFTMEAVSASIDIVKFNAKSYNQLTGESAKADYMAVAEIDMKMRHQGHAWVQDEGENTGEAWIPDMDITVPVKIRFLITGGKVTAYMDSLPKGVVFKGILTGTVR